MRFNRTLDIISLALSFGIHRAQCREGMNPSKHPLTIHTTLPTRPHTIAIFSQLYSYLPQNPLQPRMDQVTEEACQREPWEALEVDV